MQIQISSLPPTEFEYNELRQLVGWQIVASGKAEVALNQSLYHVTARVDEQLVGMGRIIGDGALFFYVQDLVVSPSFQGLGIGNLLMAEIEAYLDSVCTEGSTVGLLAAHGKESFYAQYGYKPRDGEELGLGMCKFL